MAVEGNWKRRYPHVTLERADIERLVGCAVLDSQVLDGGLRNTNFRIRLGGEPEYAVLRLYTADPAACAREVALLRRVADRVPVPTVLRCDTEARPAWALMSFLEGMRFDDMLVDAEPAEVDQACRSAGAVLAAIHAVTFSGPGVLGADLSIVEPMGYPWLPGVAQFFASEAARQLIGDALAEDIVRLVEREAWRLDGAWGESKLVHADFKPWNMLVQRTRAGWAISGVLDWEFSLSGPALCDFGVFLRYAARMPAEYVDGLIDGYRSAGGVVQPEVKKLARLIDLVSLWSFLERAADDPAIVRDVRPLLVETIDAFRD